MGIIRGTTVFTDATDDGINVRVACRNPHFVQFIAREIKRPDNTYTTGTHTTSSGNTLTLSSPGARYWRTDTNGKPNPFYDQGVGQGVHIYQAQSVTHLTIFGQPTFNDRKIYDLTKQQNPTTSETWRATAKVYAICNCQVVREISWTREMFAGKADFVEVSIKSAEHKTELPWINMHLKRDGFDELR